MAATTAVRQLDDAALIDITRTGDADAYAELFRRHYDAARAVALALTHNAADADDLTSEAFARVLRAARSGGGPALAFRPYLVAVVRNVFVDRARGARELPREELPECLDGDGDSEPDPFDALAKLPERWRRVLWHTAVEGRTTAEVAPLLGMAPNAVAALAYRAREGLRQAYLRGLA